MADDSESIAAASQTADVLLIADDDPVDDTMTDLNDTNIAECESASYITKIDLSGALQHTNGGTRIIAVLQKNTDTGLSTNLTATNWLDADQSETARAFKQCVIWRKVFVVPADKQMVSFRIRVNRKWNSLRRLGKMNDGDRLVLRFFNTHDTTAATLVKLFGTIITRR